MKLGILWIGTIFCVNVFAGTSNTPEALFDLKCASCHTKTRPSDMSKMVAPPIMGVMRHVKMTYPKKDDGVKFIVDYVLEPSKDKALCMPQKIKRFGLMPSQKGNVSKEELQKIASWIYDNFPPKGFRGMKNHRGMLYKAK